VFRNENEDSSCTITRDSSNAVSGRSDDETDIDEDPDEDEEAYTTGQRRHGSGHSVQRGYTDCCAAGCTDCCAAGCTDCCTAGSTDWIYKQHNEVNFREEKGEEEKKTVSTKYNIFMQPSIRWTEDCFGCVNNLSWYSAKKSEFDTGGMYGMLFGTQRKQRPRCQYPDTQSYTTRIMRTIQNVRQIRLHFLTIAQ